MSKEEYVKCKECGYFFAAELVKDNFCPDCQEQPKCATCGDVGKLTAQDWFFGEQYLVDCPACQEQASEELIGKMRGIAACVDTDVNFKECLLRAAARLVVLESSERTKDRMMEAMSKDLYLKGVKIEQLEAEKGKA